MRRLVTGALLAVAAGVSATATVTAADAPGPKGAAKPPGAAELGKLAARLAPVDLTVDVSALPPGERAALAAIIEAAKVMDTLFLRQVWAGNQTLLVDLAQNGNKDGSALGKARLHAFLQNKGPWLRLDEERPFLPGVPAKPAAGGFYPPDATKEEIEGWLRGLAAPARATAEGFFTTIRRDGGKLVAVPYSVEYQGELGRAAALLREAAAATADPSLRLFLDTRAAAFLSNDYVASDLAWMKLDGRIEPTIGPYEVYEDGWFNAKAAFEAFVTVRDDAETAKLAKFAAELQDIEDHLPIEPRLRNPHIGVLAPIRVVSSLFSAGDANRGVQTAAFNLPNDEKTTREVGTKRTMLKNVQEAKFAKVLVPLSRVALDRADWKDVSFDAFFTHILMHELVHGLGPHEVTGTANKTSGAGGAEKTMTVRAGLGPSYSAIEEAKADIGGLFALQYLADKGVVDRAMERTMYTTFLASAFRSIRFGLGEAHGKGIALQLNALLDAGAVRVSPAGTFSIDRAKVKQAVRDLAGELMTLEASGDGVRAAELLRTRAVIGPEVRKVLDRLARLPVDIEPRFVTADKLLAERDRLRAPGTGGAAR